MAPFFIGLLSVLLGIVSVLIVLIVLMQRPKQEGLGAAFGGGMTDQMFGAQTTNVLQKGTVYLAAMFFIFSLILSILIAKNVKEGSSTIDELKEGKTAEESGILPGPTGTPGNTTTTPPIQIPTTPITPTTPGTTPTETPQPDAGEEKPAGEEPAGGAVEKVEEAVETVEEKAEEAAGAAEEAAEKVEDAAEIPEASGEPEPE